MSKEIMRITVVLEYDVDPDLYPGAETPAERAEIDRQNFEQDPKLFMELFKDPIVSKSVQVTAITIK